MPHIADFIDAHRRHWGDAEMLFAKDRWANADHLYGLSAECGLKAMMRALGMQVDSQGAPTKGKYREHIDKLLSVYISFVKRRNGRKYVLDEGLFDDWSIHDRYANRNCFTQPNVERHRTAACRIRNMVEQAGTDLTI